MLPYSDDAMASAAAPGVTPWFSTLFADCLYAVLLKDAHSRIVQANAFAGALLGCAAPALVGRTDREFLCPEHAERSIALDRQVLASGEACLLEESLPGADGRERTVLTQKHRVRMPGAAAPLLLVLMTDVTAVASRRDGEPGPRGVAPPARWDPQARQDSPERAVMDGWAQVVWVANAAGDVIEVGPTWTRLSGRAPEAAYGHGWEAAVHPEDLPSVREQWRRCVATTEPLDVECRVRGATGAWRWVRNRAAAGHDALGRGVRWYGLLEDVHERKRAAQALRDSEDRLRGRADSGAATVWLADASGARTYFSRSWAERTGQPASQALGWGWLEALPLDDRSRVRASVAQARAAGTGLRVEYRVRCRDGGWAWVIDVSEPRLDPQGTVLGFVGSMRDRTARTASESALEESEACLRSIFDSSPDGIGLLALDGEPLLVNDAGRRLLGAAPGALAHAGGGPRWDGVVDPSEADKVAHAFVQVREGHVARFEATLSADEHARRCVEVIAAPVLGKHGNVLCMLTIWRDMSAAKAARDATEAARRAAEAAAAQLATVLESTTDCVAVLDRSGRLTYLNAHARRLLALDDAALGHGLGALFPGERQGAFAASYEKALAADERVTFEAYLVSLDRWIEVHATPTVEGLILCFRDTSERRRAEQERLQAQSQLLHMSHHDPLTNLPNRALLRERLEHALAHAPHGARLAVLSLDLDAFKPINDTYGHAVGDQLLRAVADRLRACVGPQDTVARLGGDAFAVLRPRVQHAAQAERLAQRIVAAVQAPFDLAGVSLRMTTSVGVALTPEAGTCADELMRASDVALYRAKAEGGDMAGCYVPGMDAPMLARQTLKLGLQSALARNELELFFQPLVAVATQRVCSCEALLRWRHPELGMVSPGEFIPLAEACGLITPIGEWVLGAACREAARWPEAIAVAVNLSPAQFKDGRLVQCVAAALAASGLAASRLQLEITESVLLEHNDANVKTLQALRRLGVKIAMDDFGTAYASLSYLRSFPFDKIKVDQGFIGDLPHGRASLAIVRAVAGIGRSLGIITAVEGVETQAQLEAVRAEGVDEAQGYLFSRPVPAAEVAALLQRLAGELAAGPAVRGGM
ncbi:sensor domain-containing protein [Pandoraea sputorum]|uniref:Diguanylate cyclase n=1 Tax=Pandoraea sputorum TaxID=93222 RepID=A0A5E5BL08_9BURK|nr:EAL domain-containing protein [Pandoraea sputorum]VVE85802.1 diguanylate cyclase [Pandoraea sputorum]